MKKVNLQNRIKEITGKAWQPIDLIKANNQIIRLACFFGDYHWHKHPEGDELFYVIQGKITIDFKDQPSIELHEGELTVIPKGLLHCPKSSMESYVLLFEPETLKSEGEY
ncbi:MAG: cupin domain-containing protein [Candidatus Heimdallarchaeota archaeon]|nr:cupin domain-containing protein [Candidatus Heimdallarchaeota archaeon]